MASPKSPRNIAPTPANRSPTKAPTPIPSPQAGPFGRPRPRPVILPKPPGVPSPSPSSSLLFCEGKSNALNAFSPIATARSSVAARRDASTPLDSAANALSRSFNKPRSSQITVTPDCATARSVSCFTF